MKDSIRYFWFMAYRRMYEIKELLQFSTYSLNKFFFLLNYVIFYEIFK